MVYRLVSADTIEEKVMALKEKKAELFARVVEGTGDVEAGGEGAGGPAGVAGCGGRGWPQPCSPDRRRDSRAHRGLRLSTPVGAFHVARRIC